MPAKNKLPVVTKGSAGYSGTPLLHKLGIKPGMKVLFAAAPAGYAESLGPLPEGVTLMKRPGAALDFAHLFVISARDLEAGFPALRDSLADAGMLWVSWPKKASGKATDLDENKVRQVGLDLGLVDVKVCAVDEVWSGLKFVRRLKDRGR